MQTWKKGVLYAEHGWSVAIVHFLHDLLFGHVRAAIFDTNPSFQVVEMATVQLKEFNQQHAQILIRVSGIDTRVKLQSERRNSKFYKCFLNISGMRQLCHPSSASTITGSFHILLQTCHCTCRKLMTMRIRLYELIPPVKTSFKSLCSRNCFSTKIR